jgi:hypothetical protein
LHRKKFSASIGMTFDGAANGQVDRLKQASILPNASDTTTRQSWPGETTPKAPELAECGAELCGAWRLFCVLKGP